MTAKQHSIPSHVPPELVSPFPLGIRTTSYENPYETLIPAIHQGPEIFYAPNGFPGDRPAWVVRRAEDLRQVYFDTENFTKNGFGGFAAAIGEDWLVIPTELDPPVHTGFRTVLNPIFSPKQIAKLDDKVRQRARDLIAKFKDRGECDFVADFAVPFPVSIFLELLGLPQERMMQFLEWEHGLLHTRDMDLRAASVRAVKAYLLEVIADRVKDPGDDLISNALQLTVNGRKWSQTEVFGHCFNLYLGGLDTVASTIGLHFHHLATHLLQQDQLRSDSSLIKGSIDGLLRAYAAVTTARICTREISLKGVRILPGDYVLMSTPLGSNDPQEFEGPGEVRFDRNPKHLSMGYGVHRCLGAELAKRELTIAMEEMLSTIPQFCVKPGAKVPFYVGHIIHLQALPLVWGSAY